MTKSKEYKFLFEKYLVDFLETIQVDVEQTNDQFKILFNEFKRVVLLKGAKRIRPILVFIGAELSSGKTIHQLESEEPELFQDIINTAFAIEIFHTSALIYDDIIDEGEYRRGEKTIELFYREYFANRFSSKSQAQTKHLATSGAILAGNLSFSLADKAINNVKNFDVRKQYYDMQFEIIAGQTDDCFGIGLSDLDNLKEEDIIKMMVAKSGNYSIVNPLLCGAIIANKKSESAFVEIKNSINKIGQKIGIVFQLTDDFLGIFESTQNTGKSNITDIIDGKNTLIALNTYNQSTNEEKVKIKTILGNKNYIMEEINWYKNHIQNLNIHKSLLQYCASLNDEIISSIKSSFGNNQQVEFLMQLCNYLIIRTN